MRIWLSVPDQWIAWKDTVSEMSYYDILSGTLNFTVGLVSQSMVLRCSKAQLKWTRCDFSYWFCLQLWL